MIYNNFKQIIDKIQNESLTNRLVAAAAHDEHTLEAVFQARRDRIVEPLLIGDADKIRAIVRALGDVIDDDCVINAKDDAEAAFLAVQAIRDNRAETVDADLLVVPNITTGNVLGNCLQYSAGAKMAGMIVGAQVPIVLTSRGASSEEKYLSLVLAAMVER